MIIQSFATEYAKLLLSLTVNILESTFLTAKFPI